MFRIMPYSIILISIILDQFTKFMAQNFIVSPLDHNWLLHDYQPRDIQVTSFFNIVSVYNKGISFGILNGGTLSPWVFIGFTVCVCVFLFLWLKREKKFWPRVFLSLIIGGALGNMIDRFIRGAVFDFLDFHLGTYHWPAFNIADSCIVVGVILLFLCNLSKTKHHQ